MEVKVYQLHKRASLEYKNIQDKYSFSNSTKCLALSDGTTQSFKSELWANMLVDNFVYNPGFDINFVKDEFKRLAFNFKDINFEFSTNFAKASLEKSKRENGGTATFIGIQFLDNSSIKVINCGDTCLFIIRQNQIISYPYNSFEQLDSNNKFINSKKLLEDEIGDDFFDTNVIPIVEGDIIMLATDAISRLFFKKPKNISLILKCNNFDELKTFCETNWEKKELEEDDISLIIVYPNLPDKVIKIIPPENFTYPPIIEKEFIPSIKNQNYFNTTEMEQFNNIIQQLFKETGFLKAKLKLMQTLLFSTLALLVLNTLLLCYFLNKKTTANSTTESIQSISTELPIKERNNSSENKLKKTGKEQNELTLVKDITTKSEKKIQKSKINNNSDNLNSEQSSENIEKDKTAKAIIKKDTLKP